MTSTPARSSIRRDVIRNRDRIVAAAQEAFSRDGLGSPLERIAKSAGLGNATLYRHFPTRDSLWDAALAGSLREILLVVEGAVGRMDASEGVEHYLAGSLEIESRSGGFAGLMTTRYTQGTQLYELRREIQQRIDDLVTHALDTKAIRPDVTETDFAVIVTALSSVAQATRAIAPETWRRLLRLMLDGLRPITPTPFPAPPLKRNQVWRAYARLSRDAPSAPRLDKKRELGPQE